MPKSRKRVRTTSATVANEGRRGSRIALSVVAASMLFAGGFSIAQGSGGAPAMAQVSLETLMRPASIPDVVIGRVDAPVTIVEYASMTCGHCAKFSNDTFDQVKREMIDTGRIRFVMRQFPLDAVAMAAAMLTRCVPADRALPLQEALFSTQATWIQSGDKVAALSQVSSDYGLDGDGVRECLGRIDLQRGLNEVKNHGASLGVSSTPTFFVDGKPIVGAVPYSTLDEAVSAASSK